MIIKNAIIYTEQKAFQKGELYIQDGKFSSQTTEHTVIDANGCYAIPGLIDLHLHGCGGHDLCDGTLESLASIAQYEARAGITAICPATMTLPKQDLINILRTAAEYKNQCQQSGAHADLVGINMEGPFISSAKKGAQDPQHIVSCSTQTAREFIEASDGLVKLIGIAPECNPDFVSFITQLKDQVHISLAHTNADYTTAKAAFDAGADHAVHLYNAMPAFTHRQPGVIGAVCDSPHVYAELICDGIHIHPCVVKSTFKLFGAERMVLISDSMMATGMEDGEYALGGQPVTVKGNRALLKDGTIAGSATNLYDCMRTAIQMGVPKEEAVRAATRNPAEAVGLEEECGALLPGRRADILVADGEFVLLEVIKSGRAVKA